MESPFYEMTHDYQTENQCRIDGYNTGYNQGYVDGHHELYSRLIGMSDEELLHWKKTEIDRNGWLRQCVEMVKDRVYGTHHVMTSLKVTNKGDDIK